MYRALKLACQRNEATPAMRLLDDLLDILGGGEDADEFENLMVRNLPRDSSARDDDNEAEQSTGGGLKSSSEASVSLAFRRQRLRRDAAARMRSAFSGGLSSGPEGINIFAAAAALADGGPMAAEELSVEYVRHHEFISEVGSGAGGEGGRGTWVLE